MNPLTCIHRLRPETVLFCSIGSVYPGSVPANIQNLIGFPGFFLRLGPPDFGGPVRSHRSHTPFDGPAPYLLLIRSLIISSVPSSFTWVHRVLITKTLNSYRSLLLQRRTRVGHNPLLHELLGPVRQLSAPRLSSWSGRSGAAP